MVHEFPASMNKYESFIPSAVPHEIAAIVREALRPWRQGRTYPTLTLRHLYTAKSLELLAHMVFNYHGIGRELRRC